MVPYKNKWLELVELNQSDILGLIELSASVGWDYDEHEIGTVLSSGKIFGHKNAQGKIVSSAASIPYDTHLASIGMVIVHEEYRGLGLGKEVTQKCVNNISKTSSIMLIATKEGKPLYEKMGFKTVDFVHKYLCDRFTATNTVCPSGIAIENFKDSDFRAILEIDQAAYGDKRSLFLCNRIKQSNQCVVVKDDRGKIIGYGLSILGPINLLLGPIAAPDSKTAALILHRLAVNYPGKLRIDVPSGNDELMFFLEQSGFVKVNKPPIMVLNTSNMPARNNTLFAIASQAFG
ncbi:GNAT family N-acetyltransferase [Cytobacillus oceanisediminis]|uniref:GNAT family N-acetyltransferase n=1 Tax=Cytobacillus oceanisediminis TaxID=665099 RepID=UPI003735566F